MKMTIEHLGVLRKGEIELGDFTVICGENNTGKTYATYTLYGLLQYAKRIDSRSLWRESLRQPGPNRQTTINLQSEVLDKWGEILDRIADDYTSHLPEFLASDRERFANTSIRVRIPKPTNLFDRSYEHTFPSKPKQPVLALSKQANSFDLQLSVFGDRRAPLPVYQEQSMRAIYDLCFSHAMPNVFIASAERTGAAIFQNELNFSRTRLIEALASLQQSGKLAPQDLLPAIMPHFNPRYPLPVRDNVDFVNQLDGEVSADSDISRECPSILKDFADIIGGEYKVQRKTVYFKPKRAGSPKLTLVESSSAVRSLLDVGFYLRHRARKGDLLMIDEPELNLHPANQCRVARLLARLVNYGIKVFITTHSDYIAKELNTLLLLSQLDGRAVARHKYAPEEVLRPEQIRLHIAHRRLDRKDSQALRSSRQNVIEIVRPLGDGAFAYSSFDETIEAMNRTQREVWEEASAREQVSGCAEAE